MAPTKKIPCEVYSRVVGYLRPVQNWNKAKRDEFEDRKTYEIGSTEDLENMTPRQPLPQVEPEVQPAD